MPGRVLQVAVLGAGSWGTALAMQIARGGHGALLWGRSADHIAQINEQRRNARFFPELELPPGLVGEPSLQRALERADLVLLAVPSHAFKGLLEQIAPHLGQRGITWACKGFEPGSGRLLHEVALGLLGPAASLAVVTGPSFAVEVALDLPTAVTVAGTDEDYTRRVARVLHAGNFRAYTSSDMIGAELGGAVKNVLAIATGISDGMGLGNNTRAALVTRGLAEMMRLGHPMGARPETLMGLAGLGDLVLTCTGEESRNRRLGLALGRGQNLDAGLAEIGQVVEGVGAASEVMRLARRHEVKMPISEQVHGIIHRGWNPAVGVRRLLAREQKAEHPTS
jgi:glycerol-3-phosphate dehydrogenase (NAD(P)+)